jgi:hypothetical protein
MAGQQLARLSPSPNLINFIRKITDWEECLCLGALSCGWPGLPAVAPFGPGGFKGRRAPDPLSGRRVRGVRRLQAISQIGLTQMGMGQEFGSGPFQYHPAGFQDVAMVGDG